MARHALRTTPNLQRPPLRGTDFERHRSIVVLGDDARSLSRGFTIVELLIVVVVIAILAAITIVAYNGINNRAKASAASSAAQQAAKKVLGYAALNADQYPPTLDDAGVADSSTTFQYRVDNSATPKTFCVTASTQNVSYFASSESATPTAGVCAGHIAAGQTLVTNLFLNPTARADLSWWQNNWGTGATGTLVRFPSGGWSNNPYVKMTWSASTSVSWGGMTISSPISVEAAKTYRVSGWVRSSKAQQMFVYVRPNNYPSSPDIPGGPVAVAANAWTRVTVAATAPAGTTSFTARFERTGSGSWAAGDSLDVSSVIATEGAADYSFADGASPGWAWNGASNNSTSTGPAL